MCDFRLRSKKKKPGLKKPGFTWRNFNRKKGGEQLVFTCREGRPHGFLRLDILQAESVKKNLTLNL